MAKCPNCEARIAWDAPACAACLAEFGGTASWLPIAETEEERIQLSSRVAAQASRSADKVTAPDAAWIAIKIGLSALLVLLAGFFCLVFLRSKMDWTAIAVAAFFLFCAAAPWIDYTKSSRALGLAGIVFALGQGLIALSIANGNTSFPRQCSGRRWLCDVENELYGVGGLNAVAALWLFFGLAALYGSYRILKSSRTADTTP